MSPRAARPPGRLGGVAVTGVLLVAVLAGGVVVLPLAWWLTAPDAGPLIGEQVTGSSADDSHDDGYRVWARNDDGSPVRWDPCSPIELVVAPSGAPSGFLDDLDAAVARVRQLTGLDLVVGGTTSERPAADRLPYQPERYGERWAPVLVAWASPDHTATRLRDTDRGIATPVAVGPPGDRTYVSGQIVFNRDRTDLSSGFDARDGSWGATILHELGHLLGLDHVEDDRELMAVHPGDGPVEFGRGDRRGLAAIGDGGCRSVPDAQPVEVETPDR